MHNSIAVSPTCQHHMFSTIIIFIIYVQPWPSHFVHHFPNSWPVLSLVHVCQNFARFQPLQDPVWFCWCHSLLFTCTKFVQKWLNHDRLSKLSWSLWPVYFDLHPTNSFSLPTSSTSISFANFCLHLSLPVVVLLWGWYPPSLAISLIYHFCSWRNTYMGQLGFSHASCFSSFLRTFAKTIMQLASTHRWA